MEKLKQVGYILAILLISEVLEKTFGLALPGAIIGMVMLTLLLLLKVIKLEDIEEGARSLIDLLPFLFVPILVGSKDSLGKLKGNLLALIVIVVIATLVVLVVTSLVVQGLNKRMNKKRGHINEDK